MCACVGICAPVHGVLLTKGWRPLDAAAGCNKECAANAHFQRQIGFRISGLVIEYVVPPSSHQPRTPLPCVQTASGFVACQLMDALHPGMVAMKKVRKSSMGGMVLAGYSLLYCAGSSSSIPWYLPVHPPQAVCDTWFM